jgi:hypothetical protein
MPIWRPDGFAGGPLFENVEPLADFVWLTFQSVGRSQVVRQRVLVPRSQVRILAPQPSRELP